MYFLFLTPGDATTTSNKTGKLLLFIIVLNCHNKVDWSRHVSSESKSSDKQLQGNDLWFHFLSGEPKRYLFDILADEAYKRRFKIKQREIVEEGDLEWTSWRRNKERVRFKL